MFMRFMPRFTFPLVWKNMIDRDSNRHRDVAAFYITSHAVRDADQPAVPWLMPEMMCVAGAVR
jgi:hypothetical protein